MTFFRRRRKKRQNLASITSNMKAFVQWLLSFPCVFLIWALVAVPLDENLRANEFLWVGDGNTSSPYYSFLTQQQQAIDISTYPFQRGSSYVFIAWGVSQNHPFMIGEQNGDNNSSLLSVFPAHLGGTPAPLINQIGNLAITIPNDSTVLLLSRFLSTMFPPMFYIYSTLQSIKVLNCTLNQVQNVTTVSKDRNNPSLLSI